MTVTEPSVWMTDVNFRAVPRERFVDGVVDDFVDQVMKSVDARRSDVHRGTLTNGLKPFQNLNLVRAVAGFAGWLQSLVRLCRIESFCH